MHEEKIAWSVGILKLHNINLINSSPEFSLTLDLCMVRVVFAERVRVFTQILRFALSFIQSSEKRIHHTKTPFPVKKKKKILEKNISS